MLRNMTPHPITLKTAAGLQVKLPADLSGPARVTSKTTIIGHVDLLGFRIPVTSIEFGAVYNLPPEEPGTLLIGSRTVQQALPGRKDIVVPDNLIRDGEGRITGCQTLAVA